MAQRLRGSEAHGSEALAQRPVAQRSLGSGARLRGPVAQRPHLWLVRLAAGPTGGLSGLVLGLSGLVHILGLSVYGLVQLVRFGACPGLVHFGACPSRGLSSLGLRFYLLLLKVKSPFSP